MFRRILLLICLAFVVVCYAYPFFVMPFGEYAYSTTTEGVTSTVTYKFAFGGQGEVTTKIGGVASSTKFTYKTSGQKVLIKNEDSSGEYELTLGNMYQVSLGMLGTTVNLKNNIGMWISIGVGAVAVVAIIWPSRRR